MQKVLSAMSVYNHVLANGCTEISRPDTGTFYTDVNTDTPDLIFRIASAATIYVSRNGNTYITNGRSSLRIEGNPFMLECGDHPIDYKIVGASNTPAGEIKPLFGGEYAGESRIEGLPYYLHSEYSTHKGWVYTKININQKLKSKKR
jgi:hypothetical protein